MMSFYLAATALVAATLAILLRPWQWRNHLKAKSEVGIDALLNLNAAIHRDRLTELERDHANGTLSTASLGEAREELQRQLLEDTAATEVRSATVVSRRSLAAIGLFLPLAAVLLYAVTGNYSALLPQEDLNQRARGEMEQAIEKLALKMEQEPQPEGLMMLARSYKSMGRWDDAVRAFERVGPALNSNAAMLAEFAEALAQKNQSFEGRPRVMIQQALGIDPKTMLALFLAGTDAVEAKKYREAAGYWGQLLPQLEPGSEDARMIEGAIAQANARAGIMPTNGPARSAKTNSAAVARPSATSVSGRVELSPALKAKANPDDVLFIFARAVNGPRMPLAVQRARVSDLPLSFTLDDSQAMTPEHKISTTKELHIEARISKSGQAMPGKGDITGRSAVAKPGATGIRVMIDTLTE